MQLYFNGMFNLFGCFKTVETVSSPLEINGLVSLWDNSTIDNAAVNENDLLNEWNDKVSDNHATQTGVLRPKLHLNATSEKQVRFDNTWMNIGNSASLNFVGGVDEFTVVVKLGDVAGTTGYMFSKAIQNGTERQYALLYDQGTVATILRGNFSYLSHNAYALQPNDLIIWTVSTLVQKVTVNDFLITDNGVVNTNYTPNNTADVNIGSRTNGTFRYNGDIAFIACYNRVLTDTEINKIKAEFNA
ncbi:hypothetical protein [Wocania ichthyoenteri]|uniref:hypothetical protein n=1 Tax=Wocania ichthyoenteri TaxID=1230531 RepID=UPI00053E2827|nr:hypothetical protein [Wocania ichthyoenteri]